MNTALDISFFCCSTLRACPCTGLQKNVSRQFILLRTRDKQTLPTKLCPPKETDEQRSYSALVDERFDIIEQHVALFCGPRLKWIVREDCLVHRAPLRSKTDRCVPKVELQVKRQLVCNRTVRSRSNVNPKNVESCPFALCEE